MLKYETNSFSLKRYEFIGLSGTFVHTVQYCGFVKPNTDIRVSCILQIIQMNSFSRGKNMLLILL